MGNKPSVGPDAAGPHGGRGSTDASADPSDSGADRGRPAHRTAAWMAAADSGGGGVKGDGGPDGEVAAPDTFAEVIAWQRKFCNDGYFDTSDPADILAFLDPRAISEIGRSLDSLLPSERRPVRWKRGELLGSGAFGRVYLGLNEEDGTLMAAKQISLQVYGISGGGGGAEDMEELLELMEREISLMSRLRHDNIVQYIGCQRDEYVSGGATSAAGGSATSGTGAGSSSGGGGGKREEFLTIFMEYIPGGSIASLLKRFGKLNETLVRIYTRQILMGLAYLHAHGCVAFRTQGEGEGARGAVGCVVRFPSFPPPTRLSLHYSVVHRDIKGGNILVDRSGVCKLSDFGASKNLADLDSASVAKHGPRSLRGTPAFMAPEVVKQTGYGRQSDIWSVGCTVIEMATGRPPWSNYDSPIAAMFAIAVSNEMPPLPPDLSPEGVDFLRQCFNRNPRERPTAAQLLRHPFITGGKLGTPGSTASSVGTSGGVAGGSGTRSGFATPASTPAHGSAVLPGVVTPAQVHVGIATPAPGSRRGSDDMSHAHAGGSRLGGATAASPALSQGTTATAVSALTPDASGGSGGGGGGGSDALSLRHERSRSGAPASNPYGRTGGTGGEGGGHHRNSSAPDTLSSAAAAAVAGGKMPPLSPVHEDHSLSGSAVGDDSMPRRKVSAPATVTATGASSSQAPSGAAAAPPAASPQRGRTGPTSALEALARTLSSRRVVAAAGGPPPGKQAEGEGGLNLALNGSGDLLPGSATGAAARATMPTDDDGTVGVSGTAPSSVAAAALTGDAYAAVTAAAAAAAATGASLHHSVGIHRKRDGGERGAGHVPSASDGSVTSGGSGATTPGLWQGRRRVVPAAATTPGGRTRPAAGGGHRTSAELLSPGGSRPFRPVVVVGGAADLRQDGDDDAHGHHGYDAVQALAADTAPTPYLEGSGGSAAATPPAPSTVSTRRSWLSWLFGGGGGGGGSSSKRIPVAPATPGGVTASLASLSTKSVGPAAAGRGSPSPPAVPVSGGQGTGHASTAAPDDVDVWAASLKHSSGAAGGAAGARSAAGGARSSGHSPAGGRPGPAAVQPAGTGRAGPTSSLPASGTASNRKQVATAGSEGVPAGAGAVGVGVDVEAPVPRPTPVFSSPPGRTVAVRPPGAAVALMSPTGGSEHSQAALLRLGAALTVPATATGVLPGEESAGGFGRTSVSEGDEVMAEVRAALADEMTATYHRLGDPSMARMFGELYLRSAAAAAATTTTAGGPARQVSAFVPAGTLSTSPTRAVSETASAFTPGPAGPTRATAAPTPPAHGGGITTPPPAAHQSRSPVGGRHPSMESLGSRGRLPMSWISPPAGIAAGQQAPPLLASASALAGALSSRKASVTEVALAPLPDDDDGSGSSIPMDDGSHLVPPAIGTEGLGVGLDGHAMALHTGVTASTASSAAHSALVSPAHSGSYATTPAASPTTTVGAAAASAGRLGALTGISGGGGGGGSSPSNAAHTRRLGDGSTASSAVGSRKASMDESVASGGGSGGGGGGGGGGGRIGNVGVLVPSRSRKDLRSLPAAGPGGAVAGTGATSGGLL